MMGFFRRSREKRRELEATRRYYLRLLNQVRTLQTWCAEFPEIRVSMEWLLDGDASYKSKLDDPPVKARHPWDICDFREMLRRKRSTPTD